ncbi:molybdopterin cofactor-binding domain-containing protein [Saccharopolyspora mangrovi]|uniref:Molybdopterin cofactor-binding domain-containing protein n=1 Tax=Saccharopolyspora mangrovi TaxID=3082379 RepID=A0ABU6AAQ2_9PSEU|nr:molybdopterin cofactor-binding domain-containing protein [Saccharopolyspora sp. S2-29]MEB3368584.1 molybdopterin cofactor-binding domain-containing protein [Saccharopolyspora sp. S2-29]
MTTADRSSPPSSRPADPHAAEPRTVGRRGFLGYVLAAPTLVAAADLNLRAPAAEAQGLPPVPSPAIAEIADLSDMLEYSAVPTANLITVTVNTDGTVSFELPRAEVGQGITTSTAMLIAEEMDVPVERVHVSLADARPELLFNQITGGSGTTLSTYTPIRVAAAVARGRLLQAAAIELEQAVSTLRLKQGVVTDLLGNTIGIGALATKAASVRTEEVPVQLKANEDFSVIGKPHNRVDALAAVTGEKKFAMDLKIPGALPTMVCRPPTLNGKVGTVHNLDEVSTMPGVTDVVAISTGVAVRAATFGQCIDAVRALKVDWGPGTVEGKSDEAVLEELQAAEVPLAAPKGESSVEGDFTFYFRSNSALETNCAIADVRSNRAEIWSAQKNPIVTKETISAQYGIPIDAVKVHVTEGGGSFGRKLFNDGAMEAAEISRKIGKPVKLMWHRADDSRQGRTHPMATSRVRVGVAGDGVLSYEQRHTSVFTDFSHGFGEIITASAAKLPVADASFSQTIFTYTQTMPYGFGATTQLLNETDRGFNTGSMRNIYSPDVTTARELIVDQLAAKMGEDPHRFRQRFLQEERLKAVLDQVAESGEWGRSMPANTAQGIAVHTEYRAAIATLVEIDCTPETVNRPIRDGVAGPRVTKAVCAVDIGLAVNPRGLQAQIMGGINDGIANALTSSLHLTDGYFLEASWDNYFYTRQWNSPPELEIIIMPPTTGNPGGAGELGVASAQAAVACAYARATGSMPTSFPINHGTLSFEPKPNVPPIPQSPTDGLRYAQ